MSEWLIKEFGKLTGVSVRTLRHYDQIDLLKPKTNPNNGYRIYSEEDLMVLQRITALKFFGFKLVDIKRFLQKETHVIEQLNAQTKLLKKKAEALLEASQTLNRVISSCDDQQSIPWQEMIKAIEVYHMTKELENNWVADALTTDELKEYAQFEKELKARYSEQEKQANKQEWAEIVKAVENSLTLDPESEAGINVGKRCMDWVNSLYGKKYAGLRHSVWHKGFKLGKHQGEHSLSQESVAWLDNAMKAYYKHRIYQLMDAIAKNPNEQNVTAWEVLIDEMCGSAIDQRKWLYQAILEDKVIGQKAKDWLKANFDESL